MGKYQGVTAFVGMPGSGKTYGLAQVGVKALERGERVYSNAGFDLAGSEILSTFDQFSAVEGPAVILWDELPLYFNSRKWAEFPDAMLYKFTQIRKDGLRLYYSAIHEAMIDVNIRRVTFWYWHCRALTGRLMTRTLWPPEEFRKARSRAYRREFVVVREAVAAAYDTTRKVALPRKLKERVESGVAEAAPWDTLEAAGGGGPSGVPDAAIVAPGGSQGQETVSEYGGKTTGAEVFAG